MIDRAAAIERARSLAGRRRTLLGLCGPPGVGKSTLAAALADAVPGSVVVGMDGFHLAHAALTRLGRVDRKGAIDTFDADGYVALLQRIRDQRPGDPVVWAPEFHREIEDPIGGAVAVDAGSPLVIIEGNYLLEPSPPWDRLPGLLDEIWYLDLDDDIRRARLQARHESFGRAAAEARQRTDGSDEDNAERVRAHRAGADLVVHLD